MAADQDERVVRDADERRREHGDERLVVVPVVQQAQVAEQVDDLLLAEVPSPGRAVGRQAERAERRLVALGVGAGREEQDDLAGRGCAGVDELAHPPRDRRRLAVAPVRACLAVAALVADEQLDRVPEHRIRELARRVQLLVARPELVAEEMVDRREHLGPRAVVERQRQALLGAFAPVAEDGDVGVAEAVDRLELVADEEDVGRPRPGFQQVDDLALQPVRVLELVDHQRPEAQLLRLAHALVVAQQVAREQLQILEVERRLALLRGRVLGGEQVEQLLQELLVALRELVECGLLEPVAGAAERSGAVAGRRQQGEVEQLLRIRRRQSERGVRSGELLVGHVGIRGERRGGGVQLGEPLGHARHLAELEPQLPARRAQRLVDAREHPPQPLRAVRREQAKALAVARRAERRQRALEGLAADHRAVLLVQLAEARVDADRERVRAQQARAEAVDRRDPGAVEPAREVGPAAAVQRGADARAQLARRLARVRDHEHRLDVESLLADGAHEALDEDARLPGSRARGDEDLSLGLDGGELLRVHGRSTRHIAQRSHHEGHVPPFGSWRTSPARMRCA